MTPLGLITIPMSHWILPAGVLLAVALALLVWSYRRSAPSGSAHRIAFVLKLLGVLFLALCLVEPLWIGKRAKSGANLFVVAADNSASMSTRDRGESRSRGEILQAAVRVDDADWLVTLADSFQVRQHVFDSRLRRTADFSELAFDGKASAIGKTLRTIAERYRGRPLAGVLLLTDGNATDMAEQFYDLSGMGPVYPVVIGQARPQQDISLASVSVSQTAFEDAPVTIQADVEASGCEGRTVAIELREDLGRLVEHRQWKVAKNDEKQTFRFRIRPDRTGVSFYHLDAVQLPENASERESGVSSEATLANNRRTVVVDRGRGPYRILYVAGRPNWEYKFLQRAIAEDEQVQLVGLIRVAKREPKYDWRGRAGEQSNPLYRGYDTDDEEQTEQYDQPVLVRIYPPGRADPTELRDGFPKMAEKLFRYHAIILDDVEAEFFSHDQMDLIRRFVAERGGGLLMLGGKESFQRGNFERTAIGSILPVHLDRLPAAPTAAQFRLNLTREGWLQPWARLRDNEQGERERLSNMPAFRVLSRVGAVKAGAAVVATIGDEQTQQLPALVVQRFGNGRTAALTIGDIWRWGLRRPETREDMDKFWRQTVRWLVADVPGRISLRATQQPDETNQPVVLRIHARDKDFEAMDDVSVSVEVREPQGREVQLTAEPVLSERGLFEAVYIPRQSGGYFARALVTDSEAALLGDAETGWAADLEAREFRSIKTNRPLLERIARQTGGRLIELGELDDFARSLPSSDVPVTAVWVRPLWDLPGLLPAIFLFVLTCLVAEWALRRWKGMP
ncbi:MAG: hypothetical protein JSU70_03940 [Phycisphaerales bacterium]|nr:MAG: hypothetical protein JSU70_03940 [Phycisphaerales bacterium]